MKLLLIGDERRNRRMLAWGFATPECRLNLAGSRSSIEMQIEREAFHVACINWKMDGEDPGALLDVLRTRVPQLPVVALLGHDERAVGPTLRARGVAATLASPFTIEELHSLVRKHALKQPVTAAMPQLTPPPREPANSAVLRILANDDAARRTVEFAQRAANSTAAILLLGETGTGKSLLAHMIHEHSPLAGKPFVTVNCPCLNRELLESELFGHVRGAFTGAVNDTYGKVAAADGGTLFLDEIGDLPMMLQPKLLRLLQEKQYERVGEAKSHQANVRIIAATNRDLKREVDAGRFREDLFYRLNVIAIEVPALRGRPAQIMGAANAFLETLGGQLGKRGLEFGAEAQRLLENYAWPGNLRELHNVVERAAILSSEPRLTPADFATLVSEAPATVYQVGGAISLRTLENAHIQLVLARTPSLEEAARILEIDKSTLYRKRKQMESRVTQFVTPTTRPRDEEMAAGA
jgi:NtrC-family two-component system response regulator AlgB